MNGCFSGFARLLHLVRYHSSVFFRKIRPYPPLASWMLFLFMTYHQTPLNMVQNYSAQAMVMFYVMVWFGYVFLSDFDVVTEHLLILQINSRLLYAAGKLLFLLAVCALIGLAGSLYPVIVKLISYFAGTMWPVGIGMADFAGGFVLQFTSGCLGVAVAFLFHPNPDKRNSGPATVFVLISFALMAVTKHQVFGFDGPARHLLLVFTPLYEILQLFFDKEAFLAISMLLVAAKGGIYFIAAAAVGYWLYNKRVYGPMIAGEHAL